MDSEQRLIDLESKVAHQDQALVELGEEIYQQQRQIALLEDRCRQLLERLETIAAGESSGNASDEVPPHY